MEFTATTDKKQRLVDARFGYLLFHMNTYIPCATYDESSSLPEAVSSLSLSLASVGNLGDTVIDVEYACHSDSVCVCVCVCEGVCM